LFLSNLSCPARPKAYVKGPDVGSKSARTQRRYKKQIRTQTKLDNWVVVHAPSESNPSKRPTDQPPVISDSPINMAVDFEDGVELSESGLSSVVDVELEERCDDGANIPGLSQADDSDEKQEEGGEDSEWEIEAEVCESITASDAKPDIRTWDILRDEIKKDLRRKGNTLPLSNTNQLLILRNFATLRLKGFGIVKASCEIAQQWHEGTGTHFARRVRTLAKHYQLFEQLPDERRGGVKKARTLLLDETLRSTAKDWLTSQKSGQVTPRRFQHALNSKILPTVGVMLKKPLCERTARRWLIKLGWRLTRIQKGVYMDGHEREDVVKYRNEVFLPRMKEYEARMTHYVLEGTDLQPIEPELQAGQKKIIPLFHDESCFHANEHKSTAWSVDFKLNFVQPLINDRLQRGETILQKKSRG
jgi:hypothetical protein